mmetsp:Transcript_64573/g.114866  ORF Transcript_64573/g.114866 Transcript_64573/m.114866 type:complete len:200 (-) Transcript_64573:18-617(-)
MTWTLASLCVALAPAVAEAGGYAIPPAKPGASVDQVVRPGDTIFLKAYSGKHVDVRGDKMYARWTQHASSQTFVIEKYEAGPIFSGDTVYLTAHTGRRISVMGDLVRVNTTMRGIQQAMLLERHMVCPSQPIPCDGDGSLGRLESPDAGPIPLMSGETVYFKADTGNYIEVVGNDPAAARFPYKTGWQSFVVEKRRSSW